MKAIVELHWKSTIKSSTVGERGLMKASIRYLLPQEDARIFEDCIGIVDGTLIPFGTSPGFPMEDQNTNLFNYKKRRYGIQATLVCDHSGISQDSASSYRW